VQIRALKVLDFGMKARIAAAGLGAFAVVLLVGLVGVAQAGASSADVVAVSPRALTILAGRSLDVHRPSQPVAKLAQLAPHTKPAHRLK
jgi:hypothetical protein